MGGGHSSKFITLASCSYISSFSPSQFSFGEHVNVSVTCSGPQVQKRQSRRQKWKLLNPIALNSEIGIMRRWKQRSDGGGWIEPSMSCIDHALHCTEKLDPLCNIYPCFPPVGSRYLPLTAIKRIDFAGYTDVALLEWSTLGTIWTVQNKFLPLICVTPNSSPPLSFGIGPPVT